MRRPGLYWIEGCSAWRSRNLFNFFGQNWNNWFWPQLIMPHELAVAYGDSILLWSVLQLINSNYHFPHLPPVQELDKAQKTAHWIGTETWICSKCSWWNKNQLSMWSLVPISSDLSAQVSAQLHSQLGCGADPHEHKLLSFNLWN